MDSLQEHLTSVLARDLLQHCHITIISQGHTGAISINGHPLNANGMKRLLSKVAYVKQADVFFDHFSVSDQLTHAFLLGFQSNASTEEKHTEVDKLIRLLRLSRVSNSLIRMLSGGEKVTSW